MKSILVLATSSILFALAGSSQAAAAENAASPVAGKDAGDVSNTLGNGAEDAGPPTAGEPSTRYEETRGGVTARIEKVSLEHIVNGKAWLRRQHGPKWRESMRSDLPAESFHIVRVFVSLSGPLDHSEQQIITYRFGEDLSRIDGLAEFDPPVWKTRLPDLELADKARGMTFWAVVEEGTEVEQYFPVKASIELTTRGGERVRFALAGTLN
jgi:hypothetical protein